jgi:lipopolysaccharide biosynthesis glycosyltransferase
LIEKNVAIASDDNYFYASLVLLASMAKSVSNLQTIRVHYGFVTGGLSSENQTLLRSVASSLRLNLETYEAPAISEIEKRHITKTTFLKFFFIEKLTTPFFWLDADMVVLERWENLFDYLEVLGGHSEFLVSSSALSGSTRDFNAGLIGRTTEHGIALNGWESMVSEEGFSLDQGIFRTLLADRTSALPHSFNFPAGWGQLQIVEPSATIYHYVGPVKPWHITLERSMGCLRVNCAWSHWFVAEAYLWQMCLESTLIDDLRSHRLLLEGHRSKHHNRLIHSLVQASPRTQRFISKVLGWLPPLRFGIQAATGLSPRTMHPVH